MLRSLTRTNSTQRYGAINVDKSDTDVITPGGGFTGRLALAFGACVIGTSFQFGYNLGVVNAPEDLIKQFINESQHNATGDWVDTDLMAWLWALTVAIFAIGGMLGGLVAGFLANKFGRKGTMLLNNILITIGAGLAIASKPLMLFELLVAARFIIGVSCGISSGIAPLYLSETAPLKIRGLAGTLAQLTLTFGSVVSQIIGLRSLLGKYEYLPLLFGLTLAPAVLQLISLPFCPETPQHLVINKNDEVAAKEALMVLRQSIDVDNELDGILQEKQAMERAAKVRFIDLFKLSSLRKPIIISIVLHLSNQLSGINAVIFYSTSIFEDVGIPADSAALATLGTGIVNVVMTFISAILIDRLGRRTLHLSGLVGLFCSSGLLTLAFYLTDTVKWMSYVSIVALALIIISFAIGPGPIPWFIVAELFESGPRGSAMSISVFVNWFANFLVGFTYPILEKSIQKASFIPFVGLLFVFIIFTYFKVPETKNRSIEDITREFRGDTHYVPVVEA